MDVLIGWPGGDWQSTARMAGVLVGGYLLVLWVTAVLWVFRDIRSRTRDLASQLTAVTISIMFPLISLPIYVALRPPETLQSSYIRLLEREVLLTELGSIEQREPSVPNPEYSQEGSSTHGKSFSDRGEVVQEPRLVFDEPPRVSLRPDEISPWSTSVGTEVESVEVDSDSSDSESISDADETYGYEEKPLRQPS